MCAHTNKAVDRILIDLLDVGLTDFVRVGLLPKIARVVLPYALFYASDSNDDSTAAELKQQLKNATSPTDATILEYDPFLRYIRMTASGTRSKHWNKAIFKREGSDWPRQASLE